VRPTKFQLPSHLQNIATQSIQEVYSSLEKDDDRNQMIVDDVVATIQAKRFPVLLTERREHLETLAELLNKRVAHVFVMKGGMGKKQRQELKDRIANLHANQPRVIIATGRYLGEGFDDERLDTLFLALPISWRGTLTQYAGRLHRLNSAKEEVIIYDYVDFDVPVLTRMHSKRRASYKALGYEIELKQNNQPGQLSLVDLL
jgi:superfamily II DNA or RNA helicase